MPHYKTMYDEKELLYCHDLDGRDVTLVIESVSAGSIAGRDGKTSKKPLVSFRGTAKKFALNRTNGAIIAGLYGVRTEAWTGKQITLYPTTTRMGAEVVECIRVRPVVPADKRAKGGEP